MEGNLAASNTPGISDDNLNGSFKLQFPNDQYNFYVDHSFVGENFNPGIGFVSRYGIEKDNIADNVYSSYKSSSCKKIEFDTMSDQLYDRYG